MLIRPWKLPSVTSLDLELVAVLELYVLEMANLPMSLCQSLVPVACFLPELLRLFRCGHTVRPPLLQR